MPSGARRVEKYKASQAALEIKNEDHAGHGKVEIIGERNIPISNTVYIRI